MSRKDYQLLAEWVKENVLIPADALHELAGRLKQDNCRFDKAKFFKACGREEDL